MGAQKKIVSLETCDRLLALVEMGKARIIKEYDTKGAVYGVFSISMKPLGIVRPKYAYMFEAALKKYGSDDGLFEEFSQTTQ